MNVEYELALLRAFADTKSYEFQGFKQRYAAVNPIPEEEAVADVAVEKPVEESKPEVAVDEVKPEVETKEPEVVEPAPKASSKKKAAD